MEVKLDKNLFLLYIKTIKGYYVLWISIDEAIPLVKRLLASKDGRVKIADIDYGTDLDVKKYFYIKLDSKEDCKKLSKKLKLEYEYFNGTKEKPGDDKYILPWRRPKE